MGRSVDAGRTDLDDEIAELERQLSRKRAGLAAKRIVPVPRDGALVCTRQQEGLWFAHRLDPGSAVYHIPVALRLRGALDVAALRRALHALVVRHEALRTRFVEHDGLPRQVVDPPPADLPLACDAVAEDGIGAWVAGQVRRPLDLAAGPLFRAALARLSADDHVLVLVVHHIVADGWSAGILADELTRLYAAGTSLVAQARLPDPVVQPADHAAWQRARLDDGELGRKLDRWRTVLAGLPAVDFPADRPRPARPTGAGAWISRSLPDEVPAAARRHARGHQVSLLAVYQAALLTVLHRHTGQADLPIGSIFSGRTHTDTEAMVGFFANTVVLRTRADGDVTFAGLVRRCHDTVVEATTLQDVPFSTVVDSLQPERVPGRNPLFQISLTLQPATGRGASRLGMLTAEPVDASTGTARFDIALDVGESPGGLTVSAEYSTELFDADRIERLLDHFVTALTNGLATPDRPITDIDILPATEHHRVLHAWNDTSTTHHPEPVHHLVEKTAAHTPDAIAVIDHNGTRHTYRDLNTTADHLAGHLQHHGARPGTRIGIRLDRGIGLVTALLAVWKTGAAYVPLDPDLPPERLAAIRDDATPVYVIDKAIESSGTPTRLSAVDDIAYVIYTSGSTGVPKGVAVSHRGLHNRLAWMQDAYQLQPDDRVLQKTPFGFDVSVWEFFWPLATGATLVIAKPGGHRDPHYLHDLIGREGVTTLHFVPTMLQRFLDTGGTLGPVRRVFSSGEALPADTARRFLEAFPDVELHNLYGPTEASIDVTAWRCEPDTDTVPIGRPIANTRTYVLDHRLRPAPIGVPGQLFLAGTGLAHGYHHQPALTAERFPADPYGPPGTRMYATGDLARWRTDGVLEYLGRTDRQIKLHGQRIEPADIEHTLNRHDGVRHSAVTLHGDTLTAYIVGDADPADVRRFAAERLPTYMVPTTVMALPELPVTPNGKLDTARLPEPAPAATEHIAPRTGTEQWLAETWRGLLRVDRVGAGDNFFSRGGNSLLATQLAARVRDRLGVDLHPRDLFANPVLEDLAAHLDRAEPAAGVTAIVPVPRDGTLPCTRQQEGLWFAHQVDPDSTVYHLPVALRLRGALDVAALQRALHALVVRHEALRTRFVEQDGIPRQIVDPAPDAVLPAAADIPAEAAGTWITEQIHRPFDLATGPVFRTALARISPDHHILVLVAHHIIADGWSATIVTNELTHLYTTETGTPTNPLPHLPLQPADHATWQHTHLTTHELTTKLHRWHTILTNLPTIDLPTDRPRPAHPTGAGAWTSRPLPHDLTTTARRYAHTHHISFLAIHHAALLTVLHRYTGQTDLPIGSIFSGRTHTALEPLVGYFANTVVLRTHLDDNPTFADLITRCHHTITEATTLQDIPFTQLVDTLQPDRIPGRNPLFQVCLTLQPAGGAGGRAGEELSLGAVGAEPIDVAGEYARFDLSIDVTEQPDGDLVLSVEYSTELFDADRIDRLVDHFVATLAAGLADPAAAVADIDLLSPEERDVILPADAAAEQPGGLLHRVTNGADPDAVAVRIPGAAMDRLTYQELERRANRLAHALAGAGAGAGPGAVVALLLDRGLDQLVAQLAVMKAGAAWMPLDPQHPAARLAFQVDDARAVLVLTRRDVAHLAPAHPPHWCLDDPSRAAAVAAMPDTPPDAEVRPGDPAYVMYTSGSMGTPKGVLVPHRSASAFCRNAVAMFAMTAADRVAQVSNPAFDSSIVDCYATWLAGATLVSAPREVVTDPDALTALLRDERITLAYLPPALLGLMDPDRLAGTALRATFSAGEALPAAQANRWRHAGFALHNSYGPTETTVVVTDYVCPDTPLRGSTPIGRALPGHRAYVLDDRLRIVPVGVPGNLHIAGTGVTYGYLHRPSLTAQRFLPDRYGPPGARMYATGDVARWRSDGTLEYLGRRDRQVQLRGQRVELGEVEHVLADHPAVRQCAVGVHDGARLVAYVAGDPDPGDLRRHLADRLPTYMIPTALIMLPELPLTPNGKLDTARLPEPAPAAAEHVAPRTGTERWLAATWQDLLGAGTVGAGDNFFDLGGSSLLGTRLTARVRDRFGVDLHPRDLFANPVLEDLAAHLDRTEPAGSRAPIVPVPRDGTLPCTRQQEGLWFAHQVDPDSTVYHLPVALRLRGALDVAALQRALHALVARHEALRTRFVEEDGIPRQVIDPAPDRLLLLNPVDVAAGDVTAWVHDQAGHPLNLEAGPVFRTALARISPDHHILVLVAHHIIADGWSATIVTNELTHLYTTETGTPTNPLPHLPLQPADHATWQHTHLTTHELTTKLHRWHTILTNLPTIDLPTDRPRPAHPTGAGAWTSRPLPHDLTTTARRYAHTHHISFLAIHHAALLTVLHRYTGQTDLPIGSIFSGRTHTALEPLVGYFANTVVLRTHLDDNPTFADLITRCHHTITEATTLQDIPFTQLVDTLQPDRIPGRNPLFQISLTLQPAPPDGEQKLGALTAEPVDVSTGKARFDIAVAVVEGPGGDLAVSAEYATDLFDGDRIDRLLEHFVTALSGGLARPGDLVEDVDVLTAAEREHILYALNPPAGDDSDDRAGAA